MRRADAWPGRSRKIAATKIKPGDIVNVVGITNRRSTIVHVGAVDADASYVMVYGRQPWGGKFRDATRTLLPDAEVELLVEDDDPHEGTR